MKNSTKAILFEVPAMILLVAVVIGTFYAKIKNLYPMMWATPITVLIIVLLFFIGKIYGKKAANNPYF